VLGLFYLVNAPRDYGKIGTLLLSALFFSFLGDCLLMYSPVVKQLFLGGMGAFAVAHVCYIMLFLWPKHEGQRHLLKKAPYILIPFALYGVSLLLMLWPKLGAFQWPVVAYSSILLLMGVFALNRYKRVLGRSFLLVFLGALLFIISDSCIAINRFYEPIPWATLWIITTYALAQYLIVRGILIMQKTLD